MASHYHLGPLPAGEGRPRGSLDHQPTAQRGPISDREEDRTSKVRAHANSSLRAPDGQQDPRRPRPRGVKRPRATKHPPWPEGLTGSPISPPTPRRWIAHRIEDHLSRLVPHTTTSCRPNLRADPRRVSQLRNRGYRGVDATSEGEKMGSKSMASGRYMSISVSASPKLSLHVFPHLTSHRNIQIESATRSDSFAPGSQQGTGVAGRTTHLQRPPRQPVREEDHNQLPHPA